MRIKLLKRIFYSIIAVVITLSLFSVLVHIYSLEIDYTSVAVNIVDGDTFDIASGERIRLADVDSPELGESGYHEASTFLTAIIYNKHVYLDVDDIGWTDRYGRLVCLVYINYNSTHYLNVNEALIAGNFASVWDHPNEFDPITWRLYVPKLGLSGIFRLLLSSSIVGTLGAYLINRILGKIRKILPI